MFLFIIVSIFYLTESVTGMHDLFHTLSERGHARIIVALTFLTMTVETNWKLTLAIIFELLIMWKISMFSRQCVAIAVAYLIVLTVMDPLRFYMSLSILIALIFFIGLKNTRKEFISHINFLRAYKSISSRSKYFRKTKENQTLFSYLASFSGKNLIRIVFYLMYYCFVVIFLIFDNNEKTSFLNFLLLCGITTIVSLIINTKRFDFLGESWRYFEYILPAVASWLIVDSWNSTQVSILVVVNLIIGFGVKRFYRFESLKIPNDILLLLKSTFDSSFNHILVLPLNYAAVITNLLSLKTWIIPGTYNKTDLAYIEQYPFVSRETFERILEHAHGLVVIKSPDFRSNLEKEFFSWLPQCDIVMDNEFVFACRLYE